MFRDDAQMHRAIAVLLATIPGLERLWTNAGPTEEAFRLVELRGGALSAGEMLLVRVAFDLFNKSGGADFGQVIHTLGNAPLEAVGGLLRAIASGPASIDNWMVVQSALTALA